MQCNVTGALLMSSYESLCGFAPLVMEAYQPITLPDKVGNCGLSPNASPSCSGSASQSSLVSPRRQPGGKVGVVRIGSYARSG